MTAEIAGVLVFVVTFWLFIGVADNAGLGRS